MAIKTIDELDPVQAGYTVGENDVLPIAIEDNGSYTTKKIKASALGGGGGAGNFIMHISMGQSGFESEETIAEAYAAYQTGQYIIGEFDTGAEGEYILAGATYISDSYIEFLILNPEGGALIKVSGETSSGGTDSYQYQVAVLDWQDAN